MALEICLAEAQPPIPLFRPMPFRASLSGVRHKQTNNQPNNQPTKQTRHGILADCVSPPADHDHVAPPLDCPVANPRLAPHCAPIGAGLKREGWLEITPTPPNKFPNKGTPISDWLPTFGCCNDPSAKKSNSLTFCGSNGKQPEVKVQMSNQTGLPHSLANSPGTKARLNSNQPAANPDFLRPQPDHFQRFAAPKELAQQLSCLLSFPRYFEPCARNTCNVA